MLSFYLLKKTVFTQCCHKHVWVYYPGANLDKLYCLYTYFHAKLFANFSQYVRNIETYFLQLHSLFLV